MDAVDEEFENPKSKEKEDSVTYSYLLCIFLSDSIYICNLLVVVFRGITKITVITTR